MGLYLRNVQSGDIKVVGEDSKEFADLKAERTDDGRFPLWEQTGQHDADPREAYEVENRERWGVAVHDVTTDGVAQSDAAVDALESGQDKPSGKTAAKAKS